MTTLYEILELSTGEIVLKRMDEEETQEGEAVDVDATAPIVSIKFSEEALFFLGSAKIEIAKAMIEAGLNHAGSLDLLGEQDEDALLEDEMLDTDIEEFSEDPTYH